MRGLQMLLTGAVLGSFASFGWVQAQGGQGSAASGTLTGADLAEIHHLHSLYNQGTDFGNAERWINVFSEDGVFKIGDSGEWTGREAITEYRRQTFEPRPADYTYRHWNSSWVITPDGDGRATGRVYWLGFDPSAEPIVITDTGVYDDIYVRTSEGWRIQQRHAQPDPASPGGGSSRPVQAQPR